MPVEIRSLLLNGQIYLLSTETTLPSDSDTTSDTRYDLCGSPLSVGHATVSFANKDLSALPNLVHFLNRKLNEADFRPDALLAELVDNLNNIQYPDNFFAIEVQQLDNFARRLSKRTLLEGDLKSALRNLASLLNSLSEFQMKLRRMLVALSSADKKDSAFGSSDDILIDLFDDFPEMLSECRLTFGYMVSFFSPDGELRTDLLDPGIYNCFRLVLNPGEPPISRRDQNVIKKNVKYFILPNIKNYITFDFMEGLTSSLHFSRCSTCEKFFFSADKRRSYCDNPSCRTDGSRFQKRKNKISSDPYLAEAFRFKNAMQTRYSRSKSGGQIHNKLSKDQYDTWLKHFNSSVSEYETRKAEALLCANRDELVQEAGTKLLNAVQPPNYTAKRSQKSSGSPNGLELQE